MIKMEESIKQRLATYQTGTPRVLIIEDHDVARGGIVAAVESIFPKAIITCSEGFAPEDPDGFLKEEFDIAFIDANLGIWTHPVYGNYGPNLIQPLLLKYPNTILISMSMQPEHNKHAVDAGAHIGVPKASIFDLKKAIEE